MCRTVDFPGYGRLQPSEVTRRLYGRMAQFPALQHLFITVTDQRIYPLEHCGRMVESIELRHHGEVMGSFSEVVSYLLKKRLNPNLLEAVLNIVNNSIIPLWLDGGREVSRIELSSLLCLQKRRVVGVGGTESAIAERARVLIKGLSIDELIAEKVVHVKVVSREEIAHASYVAAMRLRKERTGQGFLPFALPASKKP